MCMRVLICGCCSYSDRKMNKIREKQTRKEKAEREREKEKIK